jgi:hypothetical protein
VQIAFLFSLIGSDGQFTWGAWSDDAIQDPGWFDYHDHFTLAEAGSPASESSNYPLKAMPLMDNTCRWGYGFTPTGTEIGVCYVPPTPTPIVPGRITGIVYRDNNNNSSRDSGEDGLSGATVTVRAGSCSGSSVGSTTTGNSGNFDFTVDAGTYCVEVTYPTECFVKPWLPSTSTQQTITVGPGGTETISFGYAPYVC